VILRWRERLAEVKPINYRRQVDETEIYRRGLPEAGAGEAQATTPLAITIANRWMEAGRKR